MTEVPDQAAFQPLLPSFDAYNPLLHIESIKWYDPPVPPALSDDDEMILSPRPFFLEEFRLMATPEEWNRYIRLGFYTHMNGSNFKEEWSQTPINWLIRHKMIWYNFMHHVDRKIDVHPTLEAWATQVSRPSLSL